MFAPVNDVKSNKLFWLESNSLVQITNTADNETGDVLILEAISEDSISGSANKQVKIFPFPKSVNAMNEQYITPSTHLVYAITW